MRDLRCGSRAAPTAGRCTNSNTNCVRTADVIDPLPGPGADAGFQPADAAAADWNGVVVSRGQFHQLTVAVPAMSDDPIDVDDVTAVDANEPVLIEPRLHFADRQRTEELQGAVEDICVMSVGVNSDDIFDGDELRRSISLDRQMLGDTRRWAAGAPKWRVGPSAKLNLAIRSGLSGGGNQCVGNLHGLRGCWQI